MDTVLGVAVFDPQGQVRSVDAGAAKLLRTPSAELVGRAWSDLVPRGVAQAWGGAVAEFLAAPLPRTVGSVGHEVRLKRADGSTVGVGLWVLPLVGPDRALAALAIDLQVEWARSRSEANLRAAQRITHCGSWELDLTNLNDLDRNPLRWSDEVFRIFGHAPGSIEVTNENFFAAVHPEDRALISDAVKRAVNDGTQYSIDHRVIRPDGSVRVVHEQSEIQRDATGAPLLMIGTVQDVTDARAAAEQLRRAEQAAVVADRMASVGVVAAGVAHEINNPLAAVMINLDILAARIGPSEPLNEARAGLERVREIVRDLRVFARADDDRLVAVDVAHVLDSTLRMADSQLAGRVRVQRNYRPVPAVQATEARLGQVFMNLIVNAAQAIPAEGQIRVTTSTDAEGCAVIEVADTGSGMTAEVQARIFTPFFTTKDVGAGTGLGLSICQRLVQAMGGAISFESAVGQGTTFRVRLPPAPANAVKPSAPPPPGRVPGRRGRILVIDDEPTITSALVRMLGADHEVVATNDAAVGLARIRGGERFDVILCDLMMPRMTGMELHAALLGVNPDQARRLVPMTGGAFSPEARQFLAHGRYVVEKPFDLNRLTAVLDALIDPAA